MVSNALADIVCSDQPLDVKSTMQQLHEEGRACRVGDWKWINPTTGEVSRFNCNSWECKVCRPQLQRKFASIANGGEPTMLITVTNVPGDWHVCRSKWQQFIRALRRGYGKRLDRWRLLKSKMKEVADRMHTTFTETQWKSIRARCVKGFSLEYFRALERGGRTGMKHFHMLVRGEWVPHIVLCGFSSLFGFGLVTDIREVYSDGGAFYVAKYLGKSRGEVGFRKVSRSRGYSPEKVVERDADWVLDKGPAALMSDGEIARQQFRLENREVKW